MSYKDRICKELGRQITLMAGCNGSWVFQKIVKKSAQKKMKNFFVMQKEQTQHMLITKTISD